jgi:hypothetical protein
MSRFKITGRTYSQATVQRILTNGQAGRSPDTTSEEARKT